MYAWALALDVVLDTRTPRPLWNSRGLTNSDTKNLIAREYKKMSTWTFDCCDPKKQKDEFYGLIQFILSMVLWSEPAIEQTFPNELSKI